MATKTLPDWRTMTPQDLADLAVEDEATYWAMSAANWYDWDWHSFKHESWQVEPRTVAAVRERVTPSAVWFERRWLVAQ